MFFSRKKYQFYYLVIVTLCITTFNLILGPLFFSFEGSTIPKVKAAAVTWVGGATGTWETGSNWSSSAVPTSSDDVTISSTTGHIAVTLSSGQTANFSSLTIGGDSTYIATTTFIGNVGTAGSLTINSKGNIVQQNTTQQVFTGTVTVASGGVLTHTANTTSQLYELDISAVTIDVQSGGSINTDGKGYSGGASGSNGNGTGGGTGVASGRGGGGAHGGDGGTSIDTTGGTGYCDISSPTTIGSGGGGGGQAWSGTAGGGLIILNVSGTLTINGTITADGMANAGNGGAGGAGGVNIVAGTIAGTPESFTVTGGTSSGSGAAGGGGGCVLLNYTTSNSISPTTTITMSGGASNGTGYRGGAGVTYVKQSGTNGDLYSVNSGTSGAGSTQGTSSLTVDSLTLTTSPTYIVPTGKTLVVRNSSPFNGGDATGILQINSGATFTPTSTTDFLIASSTLQVIRGSTVTASSSLDMVIDYGGTFDMRYFTTSSNAFPLDTLYVKNGGLLTHGANSTTQAHVINVSFASSTIATGGSINIDGKGYSGGTTGVNGNGPGGGVGVASGQGGGGAHAGAGGTTSDAVGGSAYCVSTSPGTIGSGGGGGGQSTSGAAGGGLAVLTATGSFTIAGSITAGGVSSTGRGGAGGAGGVKITADIVAGTPQSFITVGGNGTNSVAGGGGGCIYILTTTSNSIASGNVSVAGGTSVSGGAYNGSAGTFTASSTPTAPYTLYSNNSTAQSGSTNPTLLNDTTPAFSSLYNDADSGDIATKAHIQVSTDSSFSSVTHWDSGSSGNTITNCTQGNRCQDFVYGSFGTAPTTNLSLNDDTDENSQTVYYWRLRYFDTAGNTGAYPTSTASFTLLDTPNEPTSLSASGITASAATLSWTDNSSIESGYSLESSSDLRTFSTASTTVTSTISVSTSSLSVDTRYIYRVRGTNNVGNSTYTTSSIFYTLANTAGTPSGAAASVSSITITIDTNSNPTSTKYSLYNSTSGNYLAADGSSTASPVYQTTSTWGSSFAATGLSPNTSYQFVAVSRNGDNVNTATSSASTAAYTLANAPTSLTAATTGVAGQLQLSWSANSNPAGTSYYLEETSNSSISSGYITDTTHTLSGLTPGQTYTFQVKARNSAAIDTSYSSSVSANVPSTSGGAAPASSAPSAPAAPSAPFGETLPDVLIEDFAPTGLIKIVSAKGGNINILSEAGLVSPHNVTTYSDVTSVQSSDTSLDLTSPFTLNFSFALNKHPLDASLAGKDKAILSKKGAYTLGYTTNINSGLCFTLNNGTKVCDHIFERSPNMISVQQKYDYRITWSGSVLDFYDQNQKVDTIPIKSIPTSPEPLVIGGSRTEYQPQKFAYSMYPSTIYDLRVATEPLLIYTNSRDVKLKIDSSYAEQLALKQSDESPSPDFSNVSFDSVSSELNWKLEGTDGKKCVNARFNSQKKKYKYDTYACVILDTAKPSAEFSATNVNSTISGTSDPDAGITIIAVLKKAGLSFVPVSAPSISLPRTGFVSLAGDNTTTINLKANKDGTWSYTFPETMPTGLYAVTVQTKDLAGNVSVSTPKDIMVVSSNTPTQPILPEPPKPPEEPTEPVNEPTEPTEEPTEPTLPKEEPTKPIEKPITKPTPKPLDTPLNPNTTNPNNINPNNINPNSNLNTNGESNNASTQIALGTDSSGSNNTESGNTKTDNSLSSNPLFLKLTGFSTPTELLKATRTVLNKPGVQKANVRVAVPTLAAVGIANVSVGFQLPQLLNLLRYLFGQPTMLLRRRKQKSWGVVYNGFTKLPIDLATIRLIDDTTNKVVSSQVTDFHGRYFLAVNEGTYRLEVMKPGFTGFSEHLKDKEEDTTYLNLYHGESFSPKGEVFDLHYNIPLDPVLEHKPTTRILRDHLREKIQFALSLTGMGASIMSFVVTPKPGTAFFILLHLTVFFIFYTLAHQKLPNTWGTIRSLVTKSPLSNVVVRVFDSGYNKLVNTAVSDGKGRYAILVGPSIFYVTYEKTGYEKKQSPFLDFSTEKTKGMGGLISRDEMMGEEKKVLSK